VGAEHAKKRGGSQKGEGERGERGGVRARKRGREMEVGERGGKLGRGAGLGKGGMGERASTRVRHRGKERGEREETKMEREREIGEVALVCVGVCGCACAAF
jgi:hypothetical protein